MAAGILNCTSVPLLLRSRNPIVLQFAVLVPLRRAVPNVPGVFLFSGPPDLSPFHRRGYAHEAVRPRTEPPLRFAVRQRAGKHFLVFRRRFGRPRLAVSETRL